MARLNTGQKITETRGFLYLLAKLLGEFQAARTARVGKRTALRAAGRATHKRRGKIFK